MRIDTREQNEAVLKTIELLMEGDPEKGSPEGVALQLLIDVVHEYESKNIK